eukprot:COSAG03_NODE_9_length_23924_cov_40.675690_24_plen_357_part_00
MDGRFGPYIPCNLNITHNGKPGDQRWYCPSSDAEWDGNLPDPQLCDCKATEMAVGWKDMNSTQPEQATRGGSKVPSKQCNTTALRLCGSSLTNYTTCRRCLNHAYQILKNESCQGWTLQNALCPAPEPASAACEAAAAHACGEFRTAALRQNCSHCLNQHRQLLHPACAEEMLDSLQDYRHGFCPEPQNWWSNNSTATWLDGWHPNHHRIAEVLGGSWFSTTSAGRCESGAVPGDSSGCTWRPVQLKKAIDYSCLQSNVAASVMRTNRKCFASCPDGAPFPAPPFSLALACCRSLSFAVPHTIQQISRQPADGSHMSGRCFRRPQALSETPRTRATAGYSASSTLCSATALLVCCR